MFAVIFRAKIRQLDDEYFRVAERMRTLAIREFGCLEFVAMTEGEDEIAISYWPDEDSIEKWRSNSEHLMAQSKGKKSWYREYSVEICSIQRNYQSKRLTSSDETTSLECPKEES